MKNPNSLTPLRKQIDTINHTLLNLLNKRSKIANKIGAIKTGAGMQISDPVREAAIMNTLVHANSGPLDEKAVRAIFLTIIKETKRIERKTSCE